MTALRPALSQSERKLMGRLGRAAAGAKLFADEVDDGGAADALGLADDSGVVGQDEEFEGAARRVFEAGGEGDGEPLVGGESVEDGFEEALDLAGSNDGDASRAADGLDQVVEHFAADFVEYLRHEVRIGLVAAAKETHRGELLRYFIVDDQPAGSREGSQDEERVVGEAGQQVARDDEGLGINA